MGIANRNHAGTNQPQRDGSLLASGHPWIFRSDIDSTADAGVGEIVHVLDPRGRFLGQAHYSTTSQIALRMLTRTPERVDLGARIAAAQRYRQKVVGDSTAYRLVHAEADFLPALIIDRYADCFVVQALDQGMDRALPEIIAALEEQFSPRAIVARNDAAVRSLEQLPREVRVVKGELGGPVEISMNGLRLEADLVKGQSTGGLLGPKARELCRGGALFEWTSARLFYVHGWFCAAPGSDVRERGRRGFKRCSRWVPRVGMRRHNGIANAEFREADVFELLSSYSSGRRNYDAIVLDPPAFAKSRNQVEAAARGYKDINLRALRLLGPGGILVTCSCSHHVSEAMLLEIVAEASLDSGRTLRVERWADEARDHPIVLTVPETHYLKCVILQVA